MAGAPVRALVPGMRNRAAMAELLAMSERELMDIGLNRGDLSRVFDPSFRRNPRQRSLKSPDDAERLGRLPGPFAFGAANARVTRVLVERIGPAEHG